jgi:hypothetical protein
MKIFCANENYAKYGVRGMNYFMALMGTTFYLMITGFMIIVIFFAIYPSLYKDYLLISPKLPTIPSAIVTLTFICVLLRLTVQQEQLKETSFTKDYVTRAMNFLIAYGIAVGFIIIFLSLKFLREYKGQI